MCRSSTPSQQPPAACPPSPPPDARRGGPPCHGPDGHGPDGDFMTQELERHLALLRDLIRSGRWPSFETVALRSPRVYDMLRAAVPRSTAFRDEGTLLHACLRHRPPFGTVARMVAGTTPLLPDPALRVRDGRGRTPLHVAALCRADPSVIKLLGHADPGTCVLLDDDMRTPLHLACDASCDASCDAHSCILKQRGCRCDDDASCSCVPGGRERSAAPSYDAVRALLSESIDASVVEDVHDANALEVAILSDASLDVVTLLQKATVKAMRERAAAAAGHRGSPTEKTPPPMANPAVVAMASAPSAGACFVFGARRGARVDDVGVGRRSC